MQNKQNRNDSFQLILKDMSGNIISEQKAYLDDFVSLLNSKEILNVCDDTELEYFFIKHPEIKLVKDGKKYWHQSYFAGKGLVPTFVFVEE